MENRTKSKSSEKEWSEQIDALRGDVESLRDDLQSLLKTGKQAGKAGLENATDRLESMAGRVEERVRDKPLATVAMVFGAGYLLGKLSRWV